MGIEQFTSHVLLNKPKTIGEPSDPRLAAFLVGTRDSWQQPICTLRVETYYQLAQLSSKTISKRAWRRVVWLWRLRCQCHWRQAALSTLMSAQSNVHKHNIAKLLELALARFVSTTGRRMVITPDFSLRPPNPHSQNHCRSFRFHLNKMVTVTADVDFIFHPHGPTSSCTNAAAMIFDAIHMGYVSHLCRLVEICPQKNLSSHFETIDYDSRNSNSSTNGLAPPWRSEVSKPASKLALKPNHIAKIKMIQ